VPVDMPLPKQLVSGLLVLNVVESAPQTSVCAVIYASTKDRNDGTTTVHVFVDVDGPPQAKASRTTKAMDVIQVYAGRLESMSEHREHAACITLVEYAVNEHLPSRCI